MKLEDFMKSLREDELVSSENIGKFYGGYDITRGTTPNENPVSSAHWDRRHFDYCYDGPDRHEDYRGGHYGLPAPN